MRPTLPAQQRLALSVLFAAAAVGTLAVGAAEVCPREACVAGAFDRTLLAEAQGLAGPWATPFWQGITWLGSLYVLVPLAVLTMLFPQGAPRLRHRAFVLLALLATTALAQAGKWLVERPRPDLFPPLAELPADPSYPSAHAMQATAFVLAYLALPGRRGGRWATLGLLFLASLVATSRVVLQVHYPSDVVFGVLAALCWVAALRMSLSAENGGRS
jgi:undecaprenyl-diphosphatase